VVVYGVRPTGRLFSRKVLEKNIYNNKQQLNVGGGGGDEDSPSKSEQEPKVNKSDAAGCSAERRIRGESPRSSTDSSGGVLLRSEKDDDIGAPHFTGGGLQEPEDRGPHFSVANNNNNNKVPDSVAHSHSSSRRSKLT